MNIRERLAQLCEIVVDEAKRNSAFRRRLEEALSPQQVDLLGTREDRVHKPKGRADRPVTDFTRKGGRRSPAVLDPLRLARQGEDVLRKELSSLNLEQLKDIVAQYGMDP